MLKDPTKAQTKLARHGDDIKVPVYIQGGIHGNEYEGVDAAMDFVERLATTPYGTDPVVDEILDHAVVIVNPIQNPDGRVAGTRANGNGFDLNRDFLTQSQSETLASIGLMKAWLPPEMADLHGYTNPTLIEATTKPHNPSIEYDLWLKWNQPRTLYNAQELAEIGQQSQRPINEWCPEANRGNLQPDGSFICDAGETPGPDVAEGWDDWGPFYGPMYMQHVGLNSSTVEMCMTAACGGRAGSRAIQNVVQRSTAEFAVRNRAGMLHDELEMYLRGENDAPRPACCPDPFDPQFHNWMQDYPQAYVIPLGAGQRSDAEANRLVDWLLFNDIEVSRLRDDTSVNGQTFAAGSYVVWMAQPRRGLADTALGLGQDISDRIQRLYAPPAAWSHGYLWGADVATVADGAAFAPSTYPIKKPGKLEGGLATRAADAYALELDSPTAVRTFNALLGEGVQAGVALESSGAGPAGTAVFAADRATVQALDRAGREAGLTFAAVAAGDVPALDPVEGVPSFVVLTGNNGVGATDQSTWVLRELGFEATPLTLQQINDSASDPLAAYDLVFNTAVAWPTQANRQAARDRLQAFFTGGGGYIGGQTTGAEFLGPAGQAPGIDADSNSGGGSGWSGILLWDNTGGEDSIITGAYPAQDTLIADPPTWLVSVPPSLTVDGRMATGDFFLSGLFPGSETSSAAGAPVVVHGENATGTARLAVFANNPLYRADPEREWPMVGSAAYWADGD